jgi:hypothetical protein
MKNKSIIRTGLLFYLLLLLIPFSFSQTGSLKGKIIDSKTQEPLPFASIVIENNGKNYGGTTSDEVGQYTIKPIPIGKYTIKAAYMDYKLFVYEDIVIGEDQVKIFDIKMENKREKAFNVEPYQHLPLIERVNKTDTFKRTLKRMKSKPYKPLE